MKGTKMRTTNSQMHPPRERYRDERRASALKLAIHTGDGELVVGERGWKSYLTQEEAGGVSLELGRPGGVCEVSGEVVVTGKHGANARTKHHHLPQSVESSAEVWHFGSGRRVGSVWSGVGGGEAWNVGAPSPPERRAFRSGGRHVGSVRSGGGGGEAWNVQVAAGVGHGRGARKGSEAYHPFLAVPAAG
ncbi:hypothetical protein BD779DRAFT_1474824 [Infundibulicybe gibba]|nr:hypothetical protein BD779DRAFT_1474824 [Infundibulicybe gibba]